MWIHKYEPFTEEEMERLNREGVRISAEALRHFGLPDYQKLKRYFQWKELKRAVVEAKCSLKEYESLLEPWELSEFEEKYKKDRNK